MSHLLLDWILREGLFQKRKSWIFRYGFSLLATALSVLLSGLLEGKNFPHLETLNLTAVALSAIIGGLGPAIASAALSTLGMDYFYIHPIYALEPTQPINWVRLTLFLVVSLVVSSAISALRAAGRKTSVALQQARRDQEAREQIFSIVTHDLRTPVTGFQFGVAALRRRLTARDPATDSLLLSLKSSADLMGHLISDLADCQGLESGRLSIQTKPTPTEGLLRRAVELHEQQARLKQISIELAEPISHSSLLCEEARILQVLANLIGNALKYTPENGRIVVQARDVSDGVCIKVYDTGCGIPQENLPLVFNEFWRGDNTHPGMGLGLYIAKQLIEKHGGKIFVTSEVGRGTCVSVTLPKAMAPTVSQEEIRESA